MKNEVNKEKTANQKRDWIIHYVKNDDKCTLCDEKVNGMINGFANIHTHGMEKYKHPDFQLVLNYSMQTAGYILNTLGDRVRAGEQFKNGDYVKGIFMDCDVRLDSFKEDGRNVLRVIVPDECNIFPDEVGCDMKYQVQLFDTK